MIFKNPVSVLVLIFTKGYDILLLERCDKPGFWQSVTGSVDHNETLEETVIREVKEETGIEVLQCASVDNKEDLDGLAALIEVCDLVVSTSNVTVHMAGALAKEAWVLLHYVSLYYWLL